MAVVCSEPVCKWCELPVVYVLVFVLGEPMHEACEAAFRAEYEEVVGPALDMKCVDAVATHSPEAETSVPF